jgi:protein SCO1/2
MKGKTVFGTAVLIVFILGGAYIATRIADANYQFQGSLFDPPLEVNSFTLTSHTAEPYVLSDHRGEVVVLFFGYANCPDVCPTTLSEFKRIRANLENEGLAEQVEFLFVTIDPERDTVEDIGEYVSAFHPDFTGLTGSLTELSTVWGNFFVYREKIVVDSAVGYLMEHTSRVYVVDKGGRLRLTFPFGMDVEAMTEDIVRLIEEEL